MESGPIWCSTRVPETGFLYPAHAVRSGVIEAPGRFDEHVQTHEQAESILGTVIVDDAFVNEERPSFG